MWKSKLYKVLLLLVVLTLVIAPMAVKATTFASSGVAGIGASFGAAARIGPASTAQSGSITLSGAGFGVAAAGPGAGFSVGSGAFTTGPAAAFAGSACIGGFTSTANALTIAFGGNALAVAVGC